MDIADFSQWTSWPQFKITPEGVIGDDGCRKTPPEHAGGRIEFGEFTWSNYEFSAIVKPLEGVMAQLHYRLPPKRNYWYTVDLRIEDQVVSISKGGADGLKVFDEAAFPLQYGTEYDVRVVAQYSSFTAFINGKQIAQATDVGNPILTGQIGLAIWQCRALFRLPRFRLD